MKGLFKDVFRSNEYICNTNNHLNSEGAQMFTRMLLQNLANAGVPVDLSAIEK